MNRILLLLSAMVAISIGSAYGQTRQITGKVTSSEDGLPIPGVNVYLKEFPNVGTTTNQEGSYKLLNIPANAKTVVFRFIGFQIQEKPISGAVINATLVPDNQRLEEVVVTALGVTRAKKALGYAVQDVQGEELAMVKSPNVVSSLSGRIAGVQITTATGQMGGGAKINIRGNTSLTKNNQPLFVVDGIPLDNSDYSYGDTGRGGYDYGNLGSDINPDDVENISILKGASASVLYGSRAANGVVMITTKKGKLTKERMIGVAVNSSVVFERVAILPQYQKYAGGGGSGEFETAVIGEKEYKLPDFATDSSWGPKYDPSVKVLMWNSFDKWDTKNYLVEKPWVYPKNDYRTFFNTGVTFNNNVAITSSNEKGVFRVSYTNANTTGIYPNSKMAKNTLSFSGSNNVTKWMNVWINANYVRNEATGRPETGYGDRNPVQKMWQWIHTSLDYKDLRAYQNPDGTQRTWNRISWKDGTPAYTDNPYWTRYKNYQNDRRDRFYGNVGIDLTLAPWLKITGRVGTDFYTFNMQERNAVGSQALSSYKKDVRSFNEINYEAFATINKRFMDDKLGTSFILGTNRLDRKTWRSGGKTVGGLLTPNLFNLSNSLVRATTYDEQTWKRINSYYANATIDYDRLVYLELSARNDWSSSLPFNSRSYFYPSVNLSFVASELDFMSTQKVISFLKFRGGYAQVGNDTSPYDYLDYITINPTFMDGGLNQNPRMAISDTKANALLKPEKTTSWEIGMDIRFFNNRLGIDAAYFYKATTNQIVPVRVSGATGFDYKNVNAGKMTNKGFEFMVNATAIKTKSFMWDINLNIATLQNKVVDIAEGLDYLTLGPSLFKIQSGAFRGQSYPIIYGTDYVYDEKGNKVVGTDGLYLSSPIKSLANVTPNLTAGLTNTFSYKGIDLSILLDMQRGGNIYYLSQTWGMYSGILAETAGVNANGKNIREDVAKGGGVLSKGVYGYVGADGKVMYTDKDGNDSAKPVENSTYVDAVSWGANFYDGPDMQNVYSTNYIKLREIRLGYTIPNKLTGRIKDIRISAFARNLATWGRSNKHFDPEYLQMAGSNAQGIEGGYLPSTATFGFGLNFNF